ncbi:MAG TPA: alpha/beta hydrolase [Vicinamibacterales bacterium]|nr:alpha/beta hydrolase [Vicinamibacterales bacterium]
MCSGQGSPTVVIEAGASSFAIDFTLVQRELQKSHRVCAYDRAGHGWSDPLPAFTPADEARDLHALLSAAKVPGPYVLVGASRGGLLIRGYLAAYPADVAGLVFIDPASEDRLFGMVGGRAIAIAEMTPEQRRSTVPGSGIRLPRRPAQKGAPFDKLPPELYQQRVLLDERLIASGPESLTSEQLAAYQEHERAFLASLLATRRAGTPLGDRPTVVLSRGSDRNQEREGVHAALARLSANSRHTVVAGAGHEIHLFDPAAVVTAIQDVVDAATHKRQLAPR